MSSDDALTALGYAAAAMVFAAFFMRSHLRLRQIAIASNVAFIGYALGAKIVPVLILHSLLLPLNLWRLGEIRRTRQAIDQAVTSTDLSVEWLMPFMQRQTLQVGELLFQKNDAASTMYLILSGTIRLEETGIEVHSGALLGEIGIFSPTQRRTQTARALTTVELLAISEAELLVLYRRNPAFGIYLIRLITRRLIGNVEKSGIARLV